MSTSTQKKEAPTSVKPSLQEEVSALRKMVASQKGGIAVLKKKNEALKADFEVKMKAVKEEMNATLGEWMNANESLKEKNELLKKTVSEQKDLIVHLREDLFTVKTNYDYYKALPWYKKIFKSDK